MSPAAAALRERLRRHVGRPCPRCDAARAVYCAIARPAVERLYELRREEVRAPRSRAVE